MNGGYKMDEKILNKIIKDNVKATDPGMKICLIVYYRSLKTKNLIMSLFVFFYSQKFQFA